VSNVSRLTKKNKLFHPLVNAGGGILLLGRTVVTEYVRSKQYCGSGSGSGPIRIILSDPDQHPDGYQFQENEKVDIVDFFPKNFNMLSKTLKTYDTFDTDEKYKTK
jgi:hypothetical protein